MTTKTYQNTQEAFKAKSTKIEKESENFVCNGWITVQSMHYEPIAAVILDRPTAPSFASRKCKNSLQIHTFKIQFSLERYRIEWNKS